MLAESGAHALVTTYPEALYMDDRRTVNIEISVHIDTNNKSSATFTRTEGVKTNNSPTSSDSSSLSNGRADFYGNSILAGF